MELTYRYATGEDIGALGAMNRQLADDEGSRNPMSVEALTARMEKWLSEGWQAVLFLANHQTIGYALFKLGHDYYDPAIPDVYVRQFFIARDRRRQGIGRQAFRLLTKACFPAGSHIYLDVLATNPRGQQFWAALGFQAYSHAMRLDIPESSEFEVGP